MSTTTATTATTATTTLNQIISSRLAPISLEELNAAASLLTRIDRKYLVTQDVAHQLVSTLATQEGAPTVLSIGGRTSFSYASTYFDTPELDSYMQAATKRRRRFKVRTRSYVDSDLV